MAGCSKYENKNPVARALLSGYFRAFDQLTAELRPRAILEVGCGSGHVTRRLANRFEPALVAANDVALSGLRHASRLNSAAGYLCASAYRLPFGDGHFDLVVCVEVLEHLAEPRAALREIRRVGRRHVLLSVPHEPMWRVLNLARGAYVRYGGNTPGHIQHWSARQFVDLVHPYFEVVAVVKPLPWTMVLCEAYE